MSATTNSGRPQGSTNKKVDQAVSEPSRCRQCGSTKREPYTTKMVQEYAGTTPGGKPFTQIVRRRTVCSDCGQHRVDMTYENRPGKKK